MFANSNQQRGGMNSTANFNKSQAAFAPGSVPSMGGGINTKSAIITKKDLLRERSAGG